MMKFFPTPTNTKKIYVAAGKEKKPFLALLAQFIRKGVEVRLIHAKEPGPAFREDFDKYPILYDGLERVLCPRVHFKMLIFDCEEAYIGSANLTGAGMGMKSENRRNFEAGILTDNPKIVEAAMEEFDKVWRGEMCKKCQRKTFCLDKIVT
jgi:phospholipase D domain protein